MSKWKIVKLGDVFSTIRNGASIKQGIVEGGYPITRIETISNSEVDRNKMGYAGITNIAHYCDYILQTGDILMSHINSEKHLGKTACYVQEQNEKIIHGMNLLCLRPIKGVISYKYANYYFMSNVFKIQIPNITKKSVNQASFTVTSLKELMLPLPAIEIQKQIAKNLDTASEILTMRKQQLAELNNLIKSIFYDMFGDPYINEKCWHVSTFGEISKVRQGLQIPISERKKTCGDHCYKYITIQYLNGKKEEEYIEKPKANVICTEDDVLMTRTGNTGLVITGVSGVFHNNFFLIDYDKNKLLKQYLIAFLNYPSIQADLIKRATTSTIPDLNHGEFYKINVPLPPIEMQTKYANIFVKIEEQKSMVKKAIEETQLLFDSLMSQYFD